MADDIIGNYKLVKCLGTGQMSQVWEVVETSSHRHFAMKLLLPEKAGDADAKAMLYHEAAVGLEMVHPNVIRINYVSDDSVNHYFVMEFFPSGSLKSRLVSKQYDYIRQNAHSIFKQAATGLAYINTSGWVHRDIKPDNLLVNAAGELRIIDFAIAQRIGGESFFSKLFSWGRSKTVQGTRSYMSPEQIRGEDLDSRSDIYSYGATIFELVTYRPPFRADTQQQLLQKHISEKPAPPLSFVPELTQEFSDLVMKCLAKKPDDRPQSFHDVLKSLNQLRVYKDDPVRKP
ncbi:MAG: serine/threonine protein kinase [Planctomycetes bacterium]|nr:serine/threonine protein kinase [Planctomycetota bacterium]